MNLLILLKTCWIGIKIGCFILLLGLAQDQSIKDPVRQNAP